MVDEGGKAVEEWGREVVERTAGEGSSVVRTGSFESSMSEMSSVSAGIKVSFFSPKRTDGSGKKRADVMPFSGKGSENSNSASRNKRPMILVPVTAVIWIAVNAPK